MATASIRVVKQFHYRGAVRTFSNRYHFYGGTPPDSAHWTTFSDAVVTAEKGLYIPYATVGAQIIETFGYDGSSEVPVFSKTYATTGVAANDATPAPGDCAGVIRFSTADRSSKNHPIYGFSYFHTMQTQTVGNSNDTLSATCQANLGVYGNAWVTTGFSDGATTYKRATGGGHHCTGYTVLPLITHRDLPR